MKLNRWCIGLLLISSLAIGSVTNNQQSIQIEVERLKKLKKEDPATYENEIQQLRDTLHKKIEVIKDENPQQYEELNRRIRGTQKHKEAISTRLANLKNNDPDAYSELMKKRAAHRRKQNKGNTFDEKRNSPGKGARKRKQAQQSSINNTATNSTGTVAGDAVE